MTFQEPAHAKEAPFAAGQQATVKEAPEKGRGKTHVRAGHQLRPSKIKFKGKGGWWGQGGRASPLVSSKGYLKGK